MQGLFIKIYWHFLIDLPCSIFWFNISQSTSPLSVAVFDSVTISGPLRPWLCCLCFVDFWCQAFLYFSYYSDSWIRLNGPGDILQCSYWCSLQLSMVLIYHQLITRINLLYSVPSTQQNPWHCSNIPGLQKPVMNADINECVLWQGQGTLCVIQVVQHVLLYEFASRHLSRKVFIWRSSEWKWKIILSMIFFFFLPSTFSFSH